MLNSILIGYDGIRTVINSTNERKKKYSDNLLTDIEFEIISDIILLLKPFF